MERLVKGTKEQLMVDLKDRLNTITTLNGLNPRFDVKKRVDGSAVQSNIAADNQGMRMLCLIDTTLAAYTVGDIYQLFAKFDNLPEAPVIGPIEFAIV